jgi:hypothetical protein
MATTPGSKPTAGGSAGAAPCPPHPQGELLEEARLGGSEKGRLVNAALLALSRTARCFTLYDAHNHAVREFLGDLRTKLGRALEAVGRPLELEVRAFELALGSEVVYLERERERSLAFRLYRDGVRRLTLRPGLPWDEVLGLVEILSVRYTSVRQQEEDIVTLLSKASFPHVSFVAIEGFVPDEEVHEDGAPAVALEHVEPPADWDLPLPELGPAVPLAYRPLPEGELLRLRAEPDDEAAVRESVDLVLDLVDCLADERQAMVEEDVEGLVFEVRDFLLAEGRWGALLEIVPALERSSAGDLRPRPSILARFGGKEPLRRLVEGLRRRGGEAPPEAVSYLHAVPGNHLGDLLDLLQAERDEPTRAALTALIAGLAEDRPGALLERLEGADAPTATLLLQALARAVPQKAVEAALRLKDRPDPALQAAALATLQAAPYTPVLGRAVVALLGSPHVEVRAAAIDYLGGSGDPRAYEALQKQAQSRAGHGLSDDEAERLGEALARQDKTAALTLFTGWLHPHSLLQRVVDSPAQRQLHRVAVAGLARMPGEEAEKQLRSFLEKSTGELHRLCLAALVGRRREQRAREGARHAG